ncbi:MAG: PKD domain-containing protein [Saprospiraceae bacterium]
MGKYIYLFLAISLLSCEKAIIERPDPFAKPEKVEILLDFSYRESSSASGFVRFNNLSKGFQAYHWSFGYENEAGSLVTSTEANPYTFFPKNGEYLVILKGTDVNGKEHLTRQYVLVTNKSN